MMYPEKEIRILIVEDNEGDFLLIEDFLKDELVLSVRNHVRSFREFLNTIQRNQNFDIILLDLSLPDASGESLVEKTISLAKDIPVVVLTGYTDRLFGIKSLSLGVSDYLLKDGLTSASLSKSIFYSIERKIINRRIEVSEQNYRNLFQLSPIAKYVFEYETLRFLDVNKAAINRYGYSHEEFLEMTITAIRPEEDVPNLLQILESFRYDPELIYKGIFKHRIKNGELIDVQIQCNRIEYGEKNAYLVVAEDITEQLAIERERSENERKLIEEEHRLKLFESVIKNTSDAVLITEAEPISDPGPRILYMNQAFCDMTGYTQEEVIGKSPRMFQGEKTSKEELSNLKDALKNWQPHTTEILNYRKNGEEYWVQFSVVPVANAEGIYTHWIAIERDVTERKKQEAEREALIQELALKIKDLQQFAYITSHNLRAPLSNLIGFLSLIDLEAINDPELQNIIQGIQSSTDLLNLTIEDLIRILIIKDNPSLEKETLVFQNMVNIAVRQLSNSIKNLDAEIACDFSKASSIQFQKSYLESIFLNLIGNAVKYHSPKRKLIIQITSFQEGEKIGLTIQDNGLGIDLKYNKKRIFGLYQRFHNHGDSKGLGLYLVKSQLEAMGASITVTSEVDVGTTFKILFKGE
ncbi:PAS domain S-box protein [Leptospira sp. GIMC2001]|uniref:PAS domain S-box protein n=1 Tax=Leptospira sp. GIMC2001 TaxID=1513297 RepID=UPI002349AAAE|nr:PAS domain S-box protein [Leptospira sp. GIMC2001]WCL50197.1 PAS domain S-box protein [Leptospira sp. GIMC2001]